MEFGKIPAWGWGAAALVVVVLALLSRRSSAQSAPVVLSTAPSDTALLAASEREREQLRTRAEGFDSLVGAIAGVTTAEVVARRDVAIEGISLQASTFSDAAAIARRQIEADQAERIATIEYERRRAELSKVRRPQWYDPITEGVGNLIENLNPLNWF